MKTKHYVVSDIEMRNIAEFSEFDAEKIKKVIIKQLEKEPSDLITHEKTSTDKGYWGNEVLNCYEINPKNNKPSLIIQKGGKTFYKSLTLSEG